MITIFINKPADKEKSPKNKRKGEMGTIVEKPASELTQLLSQRDEKLKSQAEEKNEEIEIRKENLEKRILELKKEGKKLGAEEGEDIFDLYGPVNLINRIIKDKFEKLSEKTAIDLINSGFGNFVLKVSKYFPKFSRDVAKVIIDYDARKTPFVQNSNPEKIKYELIRSMLAHINDFEDFNLEMAEYFSEKGYDYIVDAYPEKFGLKKGGRNSNYNLKVG